MSRKLLVSQRGDRKLLRLDPDQASLISVITLNKRLRDIAVNDVTHEAVAVGDKADELTRVKLADHAAATVALPARPRFLALDTALNVAVVGLKNKQVRFVDLAPAGGPVLLPDTVTLTDEPDALAVDATRNLAVVLPDSKRKIHFISNTTRALLSSLSLTEDADALALHAGRGLAYVLTDKKQLLLVTSIPGPSRRRSRCPSAATRSPSTKRSSARSSPPIRTTRPTCSISRRCRRARRAWPKRPSPRFTCCRASRGRWRSRRRPRLR